MTATAWSTEHLAPGEVHCHRVVRRLHAERSAFQTIEVVETEGYGIALFLDGRIQHAAADEYVYSEVMTHPAATLLGGAGRRVLVVGGGPGGVVRELLRHRSISTITQVDIDPAVVTVARTLFPHISQGCWDDPRVRLVVDDIGSYLRQTDVHYDLIIFDVSEPLDGTPAATLFARPMIEDLGRRLTPAGMFVTWAGSAGPRSGNLALGIWHTVRSVFGHVAPLLCHTHAYGTSWLTLIASHAAFDALALSAEQVDARLRTQVEGELRLYDGTTHLHLFHLPRDVRALLAQPPAQDHANGPRLRLGSVSPQLAETNS